MNEITVLQNIKYKISKKNHSVFESKKTKNLENGVLFVSCGAETGEILGRVNKVSDSVPLEYDRDVNEAHIMKPLILFCETITQARKMFENIKEDETRFNLLAGEIQKQKVMSNGKKQLTVMETITQPSLGNNSSLESSSSLENNKRLALNNGFFKPNDNYSQ